MNNNKIVFVVLISFLMPLGLCAMDAQEVADVKARFETCLHGSQDDLMEAQGLLTNFAQQLDGAKTMVNNFLEACLNQSLYSLMYDILAWAVANNMITTEENENWEHQIDEIQSACEASSSTGAGESATPVHPVAGSSSSSASSSGSTEASLTWTKTPVSSPLCLQVGDDDCVNGDDVVRYIQDEIDTPVYAQLCSEVGDEKAEAFSAQLKELNWEHAEDVRNFYEQYPCYVARVKVVCDKIFSEMKNLLDEANEQLGTNLELAQKTVNYVQAVLDGVDFLFTVGSETNEQLKQLREDIDSYINFISVRREEESVAAADTEAQHAAELKEETIEKIQTSLAALKERSVACESDVERMHDLVEECHEIMDLCQRVDMAGSPEFKEADGLSRMLKLRYAICRARTAKDAHDAERWYRAASEGIERDEISDDVLCKQVKEGLAYARLANVLQAALDAEKVHADNVAALYEEVGVILKNICADKLTTDNDLYRRATRLWSSFKLSRKK